MIQIADSNPTSPKELLEDIYKIDPKRQGIPLTYVTHSADGEYYPEVDRLLSVCQHKGWVNVNREGLVLSCCDYVYLTESGLQVVLSPPQKIT